MNQLSFLAPPSSSSTSPKHTKVVWHLYVDGASRHNPGPSGAGIYIKKNHEVAVRKGFFLGKRTNNQAEYLALILGICLLKQHIADGESVRIVSDSLLLVKQMQGVYKVNDATLRELHAHAKSQLDGIKHSVHHVLREHNIEADELANEGIDKRTVIPATLRACCSYV
jgi:ribonuclease HI